MYYEVFTQNLDHFLSLGKEGLFGDKLGLELLYCPLKMYFLMFSCSGTLNPVLLHLNP